jgi:hypothetical protein
MQARLPLLPFLLRQATQAPMANDAPPATSLFPAANHHLSSIRSAILK